MVVRIHTGPLCTRLPPSLLPSLFISCSFPPSFLRRSAGDSLESRSVRPSSERATTKTLLRPSRFVARKKSRRTRSSSPKRERERERKERRMRIKCLRNCIRPPPLPSRHTSPSADRDLKEARGFIPKMTSLS